MEIGSQYVSELLPQGEGPSFIFTHEQCHLVLQLSSLTEGEVKAFQSSTDLQFALYATPEAAFLLMKVPGILEWSDAPYSMSTLNQQLWPRSPWTGERLDLTVLLIDSESRKILGVRDVRFGESLSKALVDQIEKQKANILDPAKCLSKIKALQKKMSPEKMVKAALATYPAES